MLEISFECLPNFKLQVELKIIYAFYDLSCYALSSKLKPELWLDEKYVFDLNLYKPYYLEWIIQATLIWIMRSVWILNMHVHAFSLNLEYVFLKIWILGNLQQYNYVFSNLRGHIKLRSSRKILSYIFIGWVFIYRNFRFILLKESCLYLLFILQCLDD